MIVRLVKITLDPNRVEEFVALFTAYRDDIANFEGCQKVELLHDIDKANVFVTYSHWYSEEALDQYRKSELFGQIWPATKLLFVAKPEASSYWIK